VPAHGGTAFIAEKPGNLEFVHRTRAGQMRAHPLYSGGYRAIPALRRDPQRDGDGDPERDRHGASVSESAGAHDLGAALAIGLGGGLRSFAPAVAFALHGRGPLTGRARLIAFAGAAVELIADKDPRTPSRWSPRGMSLRIAFSATAGRALGGGPGAAVAVVAAVGAAFAGSRLRVKVDGRGRQLVAAAAEDALSYSLVLSATSALH
jgi:uncharacterized membrane protein